MTRDRSVRRRSTTARGAQSPVETRRQSRRQGGAIPQRPLGSTGLLVSAIGLGGYHIGGIRSEAEAIRVVHAAIDAGITFLDNAWEYHDGRSETVVGKAIADRRDRVFLMTKLCTHGRGEREAMRQLEQSLRRLKTDHLDLWQIHECVYDNDPERHFAPGGAADALLRAQREGKVGLIGFTGHKRPEIHLAMLAHGFPFDTCQLPLNCFDASFRSFEQHVLPELLRQGIAPLGMKSLGGDGRQVTKRVISAEEGLRYSMSLPVATTISGIDSMKVLDQNLGVARGFRPMSARQMERLRQRIRTEAADGRFELYKTTARHEGAVGRRQHGFPAEEELSA
jgi:aryl-alcohol dehydrogenase-like predicted oxidoreductase